MTSIDSTTQGSKIYRLTLSDYWMGTVDNAGIHIPMQTVFIGEGPLDVGHLHRVNQHIAGGGMGRKRFRSTVPFTPDYWGRVTEPAPLFVDDRVIQSEQELLDWLDTQIARLPHRWEAPGWRICGANLVNNKYVAVINMQHFTGDGIGLIYEFLNATRRMQENVPPPQDRPQEIYQSWSLRKRIKEDLSYAKTHFKICTPLYLQAKVYCALDSLATKFTKKPFSPPHSNYFPVYDYDKFSAIAREHGGSATSLVQAMTINVLHAIDPHSPALQQLDIMMDIRKDKGSTSNEITRAHVDLSDLTLPITDLSILRSKSKKAYQIADHKGVSLNQKPALMVSPVGRSNEEVKNMFPNVLVAFGLAKPYVDTVFSSKLAKTLQNYAMINEDKIQLNFANLNLTDKDIRPFITQEAQRWGLEEAPLFDASIFGTSATK